MKMMNHSEYPKTLEKQNEEVLRYIVKDCNKAIKVYPENPNNEYYYDEIHYCLMELNRRKNNG